VFEREVSSRSQPWLDRPRGALAGHATRIGRGNETITGNISFTR
jgi:hypothetical protein